MDSENGNDSSNIVIRIWNNLPQNEKQELKNSSMIFFPELFGNRSDKFNRVAIWLATRKSIVCPNIRDLFTAGGKVDIIIGTKKYDRVPRIFLNLFQNLPQILENIVKISPIELSEYWEIKTSEKNKIFDWIDLVSESAKSIRDAQHLNIKEILTEQIYL